MTKNRFVAELTFKFSINRSFWGTQNKRNKHKSNLHYAAMLMMTSTNLKSRYLENETFFLQIKKFINYSSSATLWQRIVSQRRKTLKTFGQRQQLESFQNWQHSRNSYYQEIHLFCTSRSIITYCITMTHPRLIIGWTSVEF